MAKKYFKKALSMTLALTLCLSLAVPAFAADGSVLTPPTETEVEQPPITNDKTDLSTDKVADQDVQGAIDKANEAATDGPAAIEDANERITGIEGAADTKIEEIQNAADEKLKQPTEDYEAAEEKAIEAVTNAEEKQAEVAKAQEQVDAENPTVDQYKAVADAALEAANARTEAAKAIQTQVDKAQAVADAAASAYQAAQEEYAALLEQVEGDLDAIGDKEALLADARNKLADADEALKLASGTLDGLKVSLDTAWNDVKTAQGNLATAIAEYLTAQGTVKTAEGVIKTITAEYGSQLGSITNEALQEKVNAVLSAKNIKDSADTAANSAGTVKSTLDTLEGVQTAVDGYATDKEEIGKIATDIQEAEKAIDDGSGNGARPEAQKKLDERQGWAVEGAGVNPWLNEKKYAKKVEINGEKVNVTGDDLSKWLIEKPQPNDDGYNARHAWLETDVGKKAVQDFLVDLNNNHFLGDQKQYLKEMAQTITKLQAAEKTLATETARLDPYKEIYGESFTTAQALQDELDRLTTAKYGTVGAKDATEFGVKLGTAQEQLRTLIDTYNNLLPEDAEKLDCNTTTALQLKTALDSLALSATSGLTGALAVLNESVGNNNKYAVDTANLTGEMATLLSKWDEVAGKKTDIENADVAGKLQTMQNAGETANQTQQDYESKHTATQKAQSDYLAAQALVAKVRGELDALQGPNTPKNFDSLTQAKLDALEAELYAAKLQLQDAKDRHEEAKQAEEDAKKAAEDAQKAYDDAVEEARRALEDAIGDDTGLTIDDQVIPLASGPVTRAQFIDYLWRHEGSPAAESGLFADHEYAPAIAWALSFELIDETFQPDELVTVADVRAILGSFAQVFGTNAVSVADLTTLTGSDGEAVMNCDQVLAEFFGEEYLLPEDLDSLETDDAA